MISKKYFTFIFCYLMHPLKGLSSTFHTLTSSSSIEFTLILKHFSTILNGEQNLRVKFVYYLNKYRFICIRKLKSDGLLE